MVLIHAKQYIMINYQIQVKEAPVYEKKSDFQVKKLDSKLEQFSLTDFNF